MSRVAGCARHAPAGERVFSCAGVVRKLAVCGAAFLAGFVPGWAFLYDQEEQWVRGRCIQFLLVGLFSIFAMWWFFESVREPWGASWVLVSGADDADDALLGGGVRRGNWYASGGDALGVRVGGRVGGGRGDLASVRVGSGACPCGGLGGFGRFVRGAVVDAGLLFGGSPLSCLPWCMAVGATGALWFLQDLWAIDYCAGDNRDASFEWLAAWALIFDLMTLVAALYRGTAAQGQ